MKELYSNASPEEIKQLHQKISGNVKRLRQEKGMSQMDLALEIGIKSIAFFSNCEANRYNKHFNIEHLYGIAKALDVDICEFFQSEED